MNHTNRRFTRNDRPGSGLYQGDTSPGIAFDDYRAADQHQTHRRRAGVSAWRRFLNYATAGLFPLADDQMISRARSALRRDPTLDTNHLSLSADDGAVTVKGSVPTHWMRERISDCLLGLRGVTSIRNELQVRPKRSRLPQDGPLISS